MPIQQRLLIKTTKTLTGRGRLIRRYRAFQLASSPFQTPEVWDMAMDHLGCRRPSTEQIEIPRRRTNQGLLLMAIFFRRYRQSGLGLDRIAARSQFPCNCQRDCEKRTSIESKYFTCRISTESTSNQNQCRDSPASGSNAQIWRRSCFPAGAVC